MLHPFHALRPDKYSAEYNANWAHEALVHFLSALPDKEDNYYEGVRRMYSYLYNCALSGSGKRFFLDKTPRYYSIIPELYRTFPSARFIFLIRNPLAVLSSVIDYFIKKDLKMLPLYREDLLSAPALIIDGIELLGKQCVRVQYEHLLREPESEVGRICTELGITFQPEMINYGSGGVTGWKFGDRHVNTKIRPDREHIDKWVLSLSDPQSWQLVHDYLEYLGEAAISRMGYSFEEIKTIILKHRPRLYRLLRAQKLMPLLNNK